MKNEKIVDIQINNNMFCILTLGNNLFCKSFRLKPTSIVEFQDFVCGIFSNQVTNQVFCNIPID